jgi:hypothetical protein
MTGTGDFEPRLAFNHIAGILSIRGLVRMVKVFQMPKRERRENPSGITQLPKLLESAKAKEEQDETALKINGWLKLADKALADSAIPVALKYKWPGTASQ